MVDIPDDEDLIKKLYEVSRVWFFDHDLIDLLECVIKELYYYDRDLTCKLRSKHINRAINKFADAKAKRQIYNSKQYFKACLLSAVREVGLEELEWEEDLD